ncbi:MAG: high frequency lysogenization protein HflD [Mariprofundaceae bacterium]
MRSPSAPAEQTAKQRAIALAALCQTVHLVDRIARSGELDADDFRVCIESLFGESTVPSEIYGGTNTLSTGAHAAKRLLAGPGTPTDRLMMNYLAGLMTIEKRLRKRTDLRAALAEGMERIARQRQYFGDPTHPAVVAAIAALYGETISTMTPRIIVRGKAEHMKQERNRQRVRALLLAGLRAAHLWRLRGGGFFGFLVRRKRMLRELDLLESGTA